MSGFILSSIANTTALNSTEPWEVFSWFGKHVATSENSASGKLLVFELF